MIVEEEEMIVEEYDEETDMGSPDSSDHMGTSPPPPLPNTDLRHTGIQTETPVFPTTFLGTLPIETVHENFL